MTLNIDLLHFLTTITFSFLIGLETNTYYKKDKNSAKQVIGTAKTYTFLGIVGYIFFRIDPHFIVYSVGLVGFTFLYGLYYHSRLKNNYQSILGYLIGCVVYSFGALIILFPLWLPALVFVVMIFILNERNKIEALTQKFSNIELETLSKMILLSVVILPLLPNTNVIPYLPLSPFKIWMAVVVISAISYAGYLTQTYLLPSKGLFLTGIIGGTYSSTATTVVLSKKAENMADSNMLTSAIIAATSMMYLRIILVALFFNSEIAELLAIPLLTFAISALAAAFIFYKKGIKVKHVIEKADSNPLELGTAFIFAALFVIMISLTHFVTQKYGSEGLQLLSFIVGLTDIDPFILSLLTGEYSVSKNDIVSAIIIASGSNNILKSFYALWFGHWEKTRHAAVFLGVLGVVTIATGLFLMFYHHHTLMI